MPTDRPSIVVPMHRTAATLRELLQRLSVAVPGAEVVLVDDACPEKSAELATTIGDIGLDLTIVRIEPNVGQHASVRIGLQHASGDVVVVMDADLQDSPEDVPTLITRLQARPDLDAVCAARSGQYTSLLRRLTARGYRAVVTAVTRGRIPRDAGMFMAARAISLTRVVAMGDPFAPLVPSLAATGARLEAVQLQRHPRLDGASGHDTIARLRIALRGLAVLTPMRSFVARRHRVRFARLAVTVSSIGSRGNPVPSPPLRRTPSRRRQEDRTSP